MKGPFLQSAELGREENESQQLFHKSDALACHLLCYSTHMAFPRTYTYCSICVWLFALQEHSLFLFFVCRDDHQMKGKVASDGVSIRIKGRRFSQAGVEVEKKTRSLGSEVSLTSIPTFQLEVVLANNEEGWDQASIAMKATVLTSRCFPLQLETSIPDTRRTTQLQLFWRTYWTYLVAKGTMWPVSDQLVVNKVPNPISCCVGQCSGLSCSHAHQSSMCSGYRAISDKDDFYRGYF